MGGGIGMFESTRETMRYLLGLAGPSGFGSSCTGEDVTQHIYSSNCSSDLTAIITGNLSLPLSTYLSLIV